MNIKLIFSTCLIVICLSSCLEKANEPLPIIGHRDIVDGDTVYTRIADFSFINQDSQIVTNATFDGKAYVADFFFTTCATICPIMTDHMVQIQEALNGDPMVKLLSHSVTPEIDSVPQLKKYALDKGVNDSVWNLVTGDREQIYNLARKAYFAAKKDAVGEYGMIHTENFVLIDKEKRLRGYYDGTDPEDIEQLLEDIEILKSEY